MTWKNHSLFGLRWPLLLLLALHGLMGAMLGLSGDEAHYALYARHLDWSYFDHPPLVGWAQWPLVALNAPDGVLRIIPIALWGSVIWVVAQLTREWAASLGFAQAQAESAAFGAGVALLLAPVLHILGIGLLPDTLLMAFTALAMRLTLRLLDVRALSNWRLWLGLGLTLGLAGLSKYTAIFVALAVMLSLFGAHGLALLRRPQPWLALALALLCVTPVLGWNAQHGWISFAYQLHHGNGSHWQLSALVAFLCAQFLLYALLAVGAWWGWRCLRTSPRASTGGDALNGPDRWRRRLPWVFFAAPFGLLAYFAGGGSSLPHWTAMAWVALAPLAGLGLATAWPEKKKWIKLVGGSQALMVVGLFAAMLTAGPIWIEAAPEGEAEPINPFTDFYGWDQAGAVAKRLAQVHGLDALAVQNWTLASRLAWYAHPMRLHVIAPGFDQFSIWSGELPKGASALVVDWSQMAHQVPQGAGQFKACQLLETLPVQHAGRTVSTFRFYLCQAWGGQAAPRRTGE